MFEAFRRVRGATDPLERSVAGADAQGLTGQIGGSVVDSSNAALPGVTVTVRNAATAVTREAITDGQGLFVFTNLLAGTYDLRVSLSGFATYEHTNIILTATERVALPPVVLGVGGVETTVTVEAAALRPATQSGERSSVIRADEIHSRLGLQRGPRQAVLLLFARPAPADRSVPGQQHVPVGGRAQREFLEHAQQRRPVALHSRSLARAACLQRQYGRSRLLPAH